MHRTILFVFLCVALFDVIHADDQCGDNGYYEECPKSCNDIGICVSECISGCRCNDGYVWNENEQVCKADAELSAQKTTIKRKCGANEKFVKCTKDYPSQECSDLYKNSEHKCKPEDPCESGCVCKDGYLKQNGICVPKNKCLPKECANDPNAKLGYCRKTCADPERKCRGKLKIGCDCIDGYLHDVNLDKCVLRKNCTTQCTKRHERWTSCYLGNCGPKTCKQVGKPIPCPRVRPPCPDGCICKHGYVKNDKDECIPITDCPSCGGDLKAQAGCGSICGTKCTGINKTETIQCPSIEYCAFNGCNCRKGHVYDTNLRKCVKKEECTRPCGKNEEYIYCGKPCPEASCDNPNPKPCLLKSCKTACFCKDGYVRDKNNKCVSKESCSTIKCKKNSYATDCPDPCPATCSHTLPQPCKKACRPGCQCNDGYVLDKLGGECVQVEKCKDLGICSANETWVNCNPNCSDQHCPYDDDPQPVCDAPYNCPGGCRCKINYRRHPDGQCKLASECPPVKCTRKNEIWDPCPSCSPNDCSVAFVPPITCNTLILNCQPQCVCAKGYFKNEQGECVPPKECRYCKDPNAQFVDKPDPCPATCQYTLPRPCEKFVYPGCQCNKGYVLSEIGGICVKLEECSQYANCGTNQSFVDCNHRCPGRVCPSDDSRLACRPANPCAGGCGCKLGYRWNSNNECIWGGDCPEIECTRPNEYFHSCSDPDLMDDCTNRQNQDDLPPSSICNPWCVCNKGFFRDPSYNCVPEDQCPT